MRDFTKSMMSYAWAMSMLGVQQVVNLMTPDRDGGGVTRRATETFENITDATADNFGRTVRATFDTGDNLQRAMVDLFFGGFLAGGCDPNSWLRMGGDAFNQANEWTRRSAQTAGDYARYTAETSTGYAGDRSDYDEQRQTRRQRSSRFGSSQQGCCGSTQR